MAVVTRCYVPAKISQELKKTPMAVKFCTYSAQNIFLFICHKLEKKI